LDARFRVGIFRRTLVDADAKTYWGTIGFEQQNDDEQENNESLEVIIGDEPASASSTMSEASNDKPKGSEVKGSVSWVGGLEPLLSLFFYYAVTELDGLSDDDDDDDDEGRRG
jgi:hypothetical protein